MKDFIGRLWPPQATATSPLEVSLPLLQLLLSEITYLTCAPALREKLCIYSLTSCGQGGAHALRSVGVAMIHFGSEGLSAGRQVICVVLECRYGLYLQSCVLIKESCGKANLSHRAHGVCVCVCGVCLVCAWCVCVLGVCVCVYCVFGVCGVCFLYVVHVCVWCVWYMCIYVQYVCICDVCAVYACMHACSVYDGCMWCFCVCMVCGVYVYVCGMCVYLCVVCV